MKKITQKENEFPILFRCWASLFFGERQVLEWIESKMTRCSLDLPELQLCQRKLRFGRALGFVNFCRSCK